jgi:hypothetical protein
MSKYIVTRTDDDGNPISIQLEFDESQYKFLRSMVVTGNWDVTIWRNLWNHPPFTEANFLEWDYPGNKREEIPADLSFARFWEEYDNKVGNKKKIEKQFSLLSESDKIDIFKAIPRYHRWLIVTSIAQAMASTWLGQERWKNDYSKKR